MTNLSPELKQRINADRSATFQVQDDSGVLVYQVLPNSPASKVGMKTGDVIKKIDGQEVTKASQVQQIVEDTAVGRSLKLDVKRNGQLVSVAVQPEPIPAQLTQSNR
jgi:S1-C subfamily serine protease